MREAQRFVDERRISATAASVADRYAGGRYDGFLISADIIKRCHLAGIDDDTISFVVETALELGCDPEGDLRGHLALRSEYGKPYCAPEPSELEQFEQEILLCVRSGTYETLVDE